VPWPPDVPSGAQDALGQGPSPGEAGPSVAPAVPTSGPDGVGADATTGGWASVARGFTASEWCSLRGMGDAGVPSAGRVCPPRGSVGQRRGVMGRGDFAGATVRSATAKTRACKLSETAAPTPGRPEAPTPRPSTESNIKNPLSKVTPWKANPRPRRRESPPQKPQDFGAVGRPYGLRRLHVPEGAASPRPQPSAGKGGSRGVSPGKASPPPADPSGHRGGRPGPWVVGPGNFPGPAWRARSQRSDGGALTGLR
jgi:hypothetical protein